jgi:hypothetical protein
MLRVGARPRQAQAEPMAPIDLLSTRVSDEQIAGLLTGQRLDLESLLSSRCISAADFWNHRAVFGSVFRLSQARRTDPLRQNGIAGLRESRPALSSISE